MPQIMGQPGPLEGPGRCYLVGGWEAGGAAGAVGQAPSESFHIILGLEGGWVEGMCSGSHHYDQQLERPVLLCKGCGLHRARGRLLQ